MTLLSYRILLDRMPGGKNIIGVIKEEIFSNHSTVSRMSMRLVASNLRKAGNGELVGRYSTGLLQIFVIFTTYFSWYKSYRYVSNKQNLFTAKLFESLISVLLLQIFSIVTFSENNRSPLRDMLKVWPTHLAFGIIVVINSFDFLTFTRKSGGTEFNHLNVVFLMPMMFFVLQYIGALNVPRMTFVCVAMTTMWKIIILCQDKEFELSLKLSVASLLYSGVHCFYLITLKSYLMQGSITQFMSQQSLFLVFIMPLCIKLNNEKFTLNTLQVSYLYQACKVVALNLFNRFAVFLLLKRTNILLSIVTINLHFISSHIKLALTNLKLDCHISTSSVCFFIVVEFLVFNLIPNLGKSTLF